MIPDVTISRVRDLFVTDLFKGQMGTGTTTETEADSGLETADVTTLATFLYTFSGNTIVCDYNLPMGTGDGTAYAEFEIQINAGATSFNRVTHTDLTKEQDEQWQHVIVIIFVRGR